MYRIKCIIVFGILGLSCYAVGTLPDYQAEDANTNGHINLRDCGNGRLDLGEECDCGPGSQCQEDHCCQTNCQLKLYAQCTSRDPCCEKCKYKAKGIICQEAAHDCAISEYCSGSSGSCPISSSKRNGAKCQHEEYEHENGICVYGVCKSFYEQCQDSSSVRRSGIDSEPTKECPLNSICVNMTCVTVKDLVNGHICSTGSNGEECSGQGDCTTLHQCHCNPGWTGKDCSLVDEANNTRINDEKPGKVTKLGPEQRDSTSNTMLLVGGLVISVIAISIFFVVMAFRYIPRHNSNRTELIPTGTGPGNGMTANTDTQRPATTVDAPTIP